MKARIIWITLLGLFVLLGALTLSGSLTRGSVKVEALDCVEQQGSLICFDGDPAQKISCEQTDSNTYLCNGMLATDNALSLAEDQIKMAKLLAESREP